MTSPGKSATKKIVEIFTDGACSGNPGPGGWGAVLRYGDVEEEMSGGEPATSNKRMEMMAAIMAIEAVKRPCEIHLHTDSEYLRQSITTLTPNRKARRWQTDDKKHAQ